MYNKSNVNKWVKESLKKNKHLICKDGYLCDGFIVLRIDNVVLELLNKELKTWNGQNFQYKNNQFEFDNDKIFDIKGIIDNSKSKSNNIYKATSLLYDFDNVRAKLYASDHNFVALDINFVELLSNPEYYMIYGDNNNSPLLFMDRDFDVELLILPVRIKGDILKESLLLLSGAAL